MTQAPRDQNLRANRQTENPKKLTLEGKPYQATVFGARAVDRHGRLARNTGGMQGVFNEAEGMLWLLPDVPPAVAYLVLKGLLAYKSTVPLLAP